MADESKRTRRHVLFSSLALGVGALMAAACSAPNAPASGTAPQPAQAAPSDAATAPPSDVTPTGAASVGTTPAGATEVSADTASAAPVRFVVAASGDFLIHGPVFARAKQNGGGTYDFRPMFRYIQPYIRNADLAICHFETPMAPGPPAGYPAFNTPKQLARNSREIGWDVCDTASNHTLDRGQTGVNSTVKTVRAAGLKSHGSAKSRRDAKRIPMVDVKGVKVAFLAYTDTTNGIPRPHPWSVNLLDPTKIKADAARAKAAGARVVIVNLHWGNEYQHSPSARQRQVASTLTASPNIDAIIGQHVHVIQPIEWKNGKPVVYGEGNLVSNQSAACCAVGSNDGIIAQLGFVVAGDSVRVERINYIPVTVRRPDYAVIPIGVGLRRGLMDAATLRASYNRTVRIIGRTSRVKPVPASD